MVLLSAVVLRFFRLVTILLKEAISYYYCSARIGSWQLVTCSVLFNLANCLNYIYKEELNRNVIKRL